MPRLAPRALSVLTAITITAGGASAQTHHAHNPGRALIPTSLPEASQPEMPAWLTELVEIRQARGSVLEGTSLETPAGASSGETGAFVAALRNLNANTQLQNSATSQATGWTPPAADSTFAHDDLSALLRTTAHRLEGEAFNRESEHDDTGAERLRRLARRLRNEARNLTKQAP